MLVVRIRYKGNRQFVWCESTLAKFSERMSFLFLIFLLFHHLFHHPFPFLLILYKKIVCGPKSINWNPMVIKFWYLLK